MKRMKATPTKLSDRAVEVSLAELVEYDAMGTIDVLVPHDADLVSFFAAQLDVDLDREFTLTGEKARFPTPCTVRHALTYYVDLVRVPIQRLDAWKEEGIFELKSGEDSSVQWHERLTPLCESSVALTFREFWQAWCSPKAMSFENFILHVPLARPRSMTIATSPNSGCARFVCSLVDEELQPLPPSVPGAGEKRRKLVGLASGALKAPCEVFVRRIPSLFRIDTLPKKAFLVGNGSGSAPFRAVWQHLKEEQERLESLTLVFGARTPEELAYRQEIEDLKLKLVPAYSRVFSPPARSSWTFFGGSKAAPPGKEYVQHKLQGMTEELTAVLSDEDGGVWICGSEAMGEAVIEVLKGVCDVDTLKAKKRIVFECWG
jgi:sulfite reductase alpha subunit-like flavoprotein